MLRVMGRIGSAILLVGIYLMSLILMTGLRPIYLVRQTVHNGRRGLEKLRDWRLDRRLRRYGRRTPGPGRS
jgi:hypothetical protein